MKKRLMGTVFFLAAVFVSSPLRAAETIMIDGRAEANSKASPDKQSLSPSRDPDPIQIQILAKLNELQLDQKVILQQLADMKQELYAVKVRASRC